MEDLESWPFHKLRGQSCVQEVKFAKIVFVLAEKTQLSISRTNKTHRIESFGLAIKTVSGA